MAGPSSMILLAWFTASILGLAQAELSRADLLSAMPSSTSRMELVQASRQWRKGVRTVIVSDNLLPPKIQARTTLHREVWRTFADNNCTGDDHGPTAGDLRAAMTPFIAARAMGVDSFKWMLIGDDDTVFFIDNALRMLEGLDHNLPYLLTDALWFPEGGNGTKLHPSREAPRCLPCQFNDALLDEKGCPGHSGWIAPKGCPCTLETLTKHGSWPSGLLQEDGKGLMDPKAADFLVRPGSFHQPHAGWWYMLHGGAGAIVSNAFFKQVSFEEVDKFFASAPVQSSDALFFRLAWNLLKLGPTDPGHGFCRPHIQMFDPGFMGARTRGPEDEGTADKGADPLGLLTRIDAALAKDSSVCNEQCLEQLQYTITTHIRARYVAEDVAKAYSNTGTQPSAYSVAAHVITRLAAAQQHLPALFGARTPP